MAVQYYEGIGRRGGKGLIKVGATEDKNYKKQARSAPSEIAALRS